jgi:putative N6-adenine-specific DNA methylase
VDWTLYLKPAQPVRVHVTTRRCRLYHKGAVGERILGVIAKQIGPARSAGADSTQRLFVRGVGDGFTLSLDSSGSMLHKRGIKQDVGRAPIRETLAAGALMMAGHPPGMPVVDPMCGNGTFSLEAAMMAAGVPPGWHRAFAFTEWPGFSSPTWRHIRKIAGERMSADASAPTVFASDLRADAVAALKQIAAQMGVGGRIAPAVRDFFAIDGGRMPGGAGTLVLNPPFGRRLGRRHDILEDYHRIGDHLRIAFPGWRVALFCPAETAPVFKGLQLQQTPVPHGGLRLILLTGRIPG